MELEVQDLAGEAAGMARGHTFLGLGCSRCAAAESLILSTLPVLCLPKRMPVPGPALALVWTLPHCLVCMGQSNRMLTPAPAPVGQAAATHSLMVTQLAACLQAVQVGFAGPGPRHRASACGGVCRRQGLRAQRPAQLHGHGW